MKGALEQGSTGLEGTNLLDPDIATEWTSQHQGAGLVLGVLRPLLLLVLD